MEVDNDKKRATESGGSTGPTEANPPARQRRRLATATGRPKPTLSWLQRQYHPSPALPETVLPPHAYSYAAESIVRGEITYLQFEQKLWMFAERNNIKIAISKRTLQQQRHLIAVRHLETVQQLYIHRRQIATEIGWRLTPLRPRAPCARLANVPEGLTNVEFLEALFNVKNKELHSLLLAQDEVRILKYRGTLALLQLSPELWGAMQKQKELTMRQRLVRIEEHFPLIQCFNCCMYGHTATVCKRDRPTCLFCAGPHAFGVCTANGDKEERCCYNCYHDPQREKDTDHAANDFRACPLAHQRQEARRRQTIYDAPTYRALLHIWHRFHAKETAITVATRSLPPPSLNPALLDAPTTTTNLLSPLFAQSAQENNATAPSTSLTSTAPEQRTTQIEANPPASSSSSSNDSSTKPAASFTKPLEQPATEEKPKTDAASKLLENKTASATSLFQTDDEDDDVDDQDACSVDDPTELTGAADSANFPDKNRNTLFHYLRPR